jgi:hypothetical protein
LIGGYAVGDYVTSSIDVNLATSQYGTIAGRLSEGIVDFSTAKLNGKVYVVGGTNIGHGPQRNVQIIDPATGAIGAGPAMFAGRYAAAAVVADGKLYLMGGTVAGEPGVSSSSVAVLSP